MEKAKTYVMLSFDTVENAIVVHDKLHNQSPEPFKKPMMILYAKKAPEPDRESPKVSISNSQLTFSASYGLAFDRRVYISGRGS